MSPQNKAVISALSQLLPVLERGEDADYYHVLVLMKSVDGCPQDIRDQIETVAGLIGPEMKQVNPSPEENRLTNERRAGFREAAIKIIRTVLKDLKDDASGTPG